MCIRDRYWLVTVRTTSFLRVNLLPPRLSTGWDYRRAIEPPRVKIKFIVLSNVIKRCSNFWFGCRWIWLPKLQSSRLPSTKLSVEYNWRMGIYLQVEFPLRELELLPISQFSIQIYHNRNRTPDFFEIFYSSKIWLKMFRIRYILLWNLEILKSMEL